MTRFLIAFLLPTNLSLRVNKVKIDFEPNIVKVISPHLSLCFPFFLPYPVKNILPKLKTVLFKILPVRASIVDISTFEKENDQRLVYLKVSPEKPFIIIHEALKKEVLNEVVFDTAVFPNNQLPDLNYVVVDSP